MALVKILIEGYAKKLDNGWLASSTVCLVTSGDTKIITDPGCNREKLLEALAKENLKTGDIDYVFQSHQHGDHVLLAGIFENARHITFDGGFMYENDILTEYQTHELGEDIEITSTPGHLLEHISLLVTTPKGVVAIAGDVVFWLEGEKQEFKIDQPDPSQSKGMDMETLIASRKLLIERADFIIPGHGKMFKIDK